MQLTIIVASTDSTDYFGEISDLCFSHRAEQLEHKYLDTGADSASPRVMLTCTMPLSEIVTDFFDQLKSRTSGYASFEWVLTLKASTPSNTTLPVTRMLVTNPAI